MVVVLAGWSSACLAKDYYVATDGNDTHPGSKTEPWKTIQHAADTVRPGDTVYIRGGVYRECVQPGRGGPSEDKRITIDQDLLGNVRHRAHPAAGPLETVAAGKQNSVTLIAGPRTQRETASAPIQPARGDNFKHAAVIEIDRHAIVPNHFIGFGNQWGPTSSSPVLRIGT